jgi:hypothetical protein
MQIPQILLGTLAIIAVTLLVIGVAAALITAVVRSSEKKGRSGALSQAMQNVQSILEPSRRPVVELEQRREELEEEDVSGEGVG